LTALSSNEVVRDAKNAPGCGQASWCLNKTVSRVINNDAHVAAGTRHEVLRIIAETGYVPHLQAQGLASGRTRSIALHYPLSDPALISNELEMSFVTGIASAARNQLSVCNDRSHH
jgi:DNA-binding LacI/PurR family transcriptional regulator